MDGSLTKKIKFNTELNIYYGLFSYTEIINLIDNGATPTGGYQYSKKDLQHEIGTGRNRSTYFYFNINYFVSTIGHIQFTEYLFKFI